MRFIEPLTLTGPQWRTLEPMECRHEPELLEAAKDGELCKLWYTAIASPDAVMGYMNDALKMRDEHGAMPFIVRRKSDGKVVARPIQSSSPWMPVSRLRMRRFALNLNRQARPSVPTTPGLPLRHCTTSWFW